MTPAQTILLNVGLKTSAVTDYKTVDAANVLSFLKGKDCYEITQPHKDTPTRTLNRVYVDLDAKLDDDITEAEFDATHELVLEKLVEYATEKGFAIMESSKWRCYDDKSSRFNKLSYRLSAPRICGTKEAIKAFVKNTITPELKETLETLIEVTDGKCDTGALNVDMSVYDKNRKMRMLYASKPNQNRPNKLVLGNAEDLLITYIPEGCVQLPEPLAETLSRPFPAVRPRAQEAESDNEEQPSLASTGDPSNDEAESKGLLAKVISHLGQHRWDSYNDWVRIGFVLYTEGFSLAEYIDYSKKSKHYKGGESEKWIASKWYGFKKSNLTQATLWKWLSEDNAEVYQELSKQRKDFWKLIFTPNHAETAQFFYNMKPDAYVYNEKLGWYMLQTSNIWKHYDKKPNGLLSDIWNTLRKITKEHFDALPTNETDAAKIATQRLKAKALKAFEMMVGNKSHCEGVIAFLPSMYNDDELDKKMDESRHLLAFSDMVYDLDKGDPRPVG